MEEDEGSHHLDLSAGEQRPRSAHVHGGRRKERKCEAEASRPHVGFARGKGADCSRCLPLLHGGDFVLQPDMILEQEAHGGVPSAEMRN